MDPRFTFFAAVPPMTTGLCDYYMGLLYYLEVGDGIAPLLYFSVCFTLMIFYFIGTLIIEKEMPGFEIRSFVGLTGSIICFAIQKMMYWRMELDNNYHAFTEIFIVTLISLSFYASFAIEAVAIDHLASEVHRKTELFAALIIAVATYQEIGLDFTVSFNSAANHKAGFQGRRRFHVIWNLALGAFILRLGLLLKVKVFGPSCHIEGELSNDEKRRLFIS